MTSTHSRRVGVYPGSFNPPTIAHLAVSQAALEQRDLTEVVWMISEHTLGKLDADHPETDERLDALRAVTDDLPWLRAEATSLQLLSDIAEPFDVVIMGADKWHQINELQWYADEDDRAVQLDRLPELAIAPRSDLEVPIEHALTLDPSFSEVSSTAARNGDASALAPRVAPAPSERSADSGPVSE